MGCGKSKLDVAADTTIKSASRSVSKRNKQRDEGSSAKVGKDVKTIPDKVENGNKVESVSAPQQTGGGSEKIENKNEKPKEEESPAKAGEIVAENVVSEELHDVDKKDDSNSPKIKGEPAGAAKIAGIEAVVVDAEKPKDVAEAQPPMVEEKAPVEETKTETINEAPAIVMEEKEAEAVLAVEPEASTPTAPEVSATPAEEKETEAVTVVPVEPEASAAPAEEKEETEAVALPVQPEGPAEPAQEKETEAVVEPAESESVATTTEQEKIPEDEETVAPTAESPAEDTKAN